MESDIKNPNFLSLSNEEIKAVTWDFYGGRLDQVQRCQRLFNVQGNDWGFKDAFKLCLAYSIMMGESGGYLKAFHHNVSRNDDGSVKRIIQNGQTFMEIPSTDLGFIQKNIVHSPHAIVEMTEEASYNFINDLFDSYPDLADGYKSSKIAWNMSKQGTDFSPWYAYLNGGYKRSLGNSCVAVGKFLANKYLNDPDYVIVNPDRV